MRFQNFTKSRIIQTNGLWDTILGQIAIACLIFYSFGVEAQTSTVNLNTSYQTIRGFGGINHPVWYTDLNASERDLCFGNGTGQMGLTVLRIWVSDNTSQWSLELPTAKRAVALGALVFATPWNPPSSMTITVNGKKRINPASYSAYAKHLNDFVTYMKNNGVELYAISVQNEPDYASEWTEWSPQEGVDFIKGYGDQINCRLMTPESFQYRKNIYDPILNDATALSKVDIFGTHLYGTAVSDFAYPLFKQKGAGKELWMTEVYTDSQNDANIWSYALDAGVHIHNAMVVGGFQAYVWWPLRRYYALIHDGASGHNNSTVAAAGTVTKRGFVFAQFSKFVRPGFVRVDASAGKSGTYISAYKNGGDVVIVAVNKNTSATSQQFTLNGINVTSMAKYTTSSSKNVVSEAAVSVSSNSFTASLDAQSVTTFVGKSTVTAIDESDVAHGENNISVYPNPFEDKIYVEGPSSFRYELLSVAGAVIKEGSAQNRIELGEELPKGLYFLNILNSEGAKLQNIKVLKTN